MAYRYYSNKEIRYQVSSLRGSLPFIQTNSYQLQADADKTQTRPSELVVIKTYILGKSKYIFITMSNRKPAQC